MTQKDIIDGLKILCICRGIRKKTFLRLIAAGRTSLADLQRATGAGSGACGGKRCTPRILEVLDSFIAAGSSDGDESRDSISQLKGRND